MSGDRAFARTARRLVELLQETDHRRTWEAKVKRTRPDRAVHGAAIAQVLAEHLWDTGLHPETDVELPRSLRDRVRRALSGELLTPSTLTTFVQAFGFSDDDQAELWALFAVDQAERDPGGAPDRYRTISLREDHRVGADGAPAEHRTIHTLRSLVDGLTHYPYRFDTPHAEVVVESGGVAGAPAGDGGLWGVDIAFHRPLRRGEVVTFTYVTSFSYAQPPPPVFRRAARQRVDNVDLRVQFHPARLPRRVAWAAWPDLDGPPASEAPVELDPEHAAHRHVTSLEGGAVGFTWAW